mgnify:CR=1 FL=1
MTLMLSVWCTTSGSTGFGLGLSTLAFVASLVLGAPMLVEAQTPRSPTPAPVRGASALSPSPAGSSIPGRWPSCRTAACSPPNGRGGSAPEAANREGK